MAHRLSGKIILITGASSGIGRATAIEFARQCPSELKLILTARRVDKLKELKSELETHHKGIQVHALGLDVSNAEQVRSFIGKLPPEYQKINVLINNAGFVKGVEHVGDIVEQDMNDVLATNVSGFINVTQAVMKVFRANGNRGDFVQLGSIASRDGYAGGAVYCASKSAVRAFSEAMQKETIHTRIRTMIIEPGQVETEFSVIRFRGDKAKADGVYAGTEPLTAEDIAEIIVFAVSRRENVVMANTLLFPSHQASATAVHRQTK